MPKSEIFLFLPSWLAVSSTALLIIQVRLLKHVLHESWIEDAYFEYRNYIKNHNFANFRDDQSFENNHKKVDN